MAPQRQRKSKTSTSSTTSSIGLDRFPTPPRLVPTKTGMSPTSRTPIASPSKRSVKISVAQKQALIDNLQLEITERARKLRAQYALRTQGLRSRLEMRIHRIPAALRKITIAELLEKQARKERDAAQQKLKAAEDAQAMLNASNKTATRKATTKIFEDSEPKRTSKRNSDDMEDADKENAEISNSRKRSRTGSERQPAKTQKAAPSRNASKKMPPPAREVLSPKSNNSRALPASPIKPIGLPSSPYKSNIARPVSPLKPLSAATAAPTASSLAKTNDKAKSKTAASRAASRQGPATAGGTIGRGKRNAATAASGDAGTRSSNASDQTNSSTGTTIVKRANSRANAVNKPAPAAKKPGTVVKKMVAGLESKKDGGVAGKGKQAAATGTGSTRGGRTLRKRA